VVAVGKRSDWCRGFRAGAAGDERALPRAPAAIRRAGVGGGAGSAGWWGWLARGVISARDGGCRVAVGERCVYGVVFRAECHGGWLGSWWLTG
jgi:hypothetical protein